MQDSKDFKTFYKNFKTFIRLHKGFNRFLESKNY